MCARATYDHAVHAPQPVVLSGQYVRLEPLTSAHVPDLLEAGRDEQVWRWLSVRPPQTVADVEAVLALLAERTDQAWAVVVDGRAGGSTSCLDVDLDVGGLEIGWTWYASALWGTAVNPECKLLLLGHAFDDLGAERVTLRTDALNTRSRAAIARLGAREDGTLRHARRRPDGSVRDTTCFSILAAEWPAVQAGLRARLSRWSAARPIPAGPEHPRSTS